MDEKYKSAATASPGNWRHVQVVTLFFCVGCAITMRVCLSVAVVVMTGKDENGDGQQRFDWLPTEKSAVLGAFLWGYMCTQVVGGALSARGWAKVTLTAALAASGLLTALLPLAAGAGGAAATTAVRVGTGVIQGAIYPTSYTLIGRWVPPSERSRAGNLVLAAQPLGNILASALSGWISILWGWPAIFYVFGASGVVAGLLVFIIIADSPASHPHISKAERDFIAEALSVTSDASPRPKLAVPWCSMLCSIPLWALVAAHVGYLWGYWVIIACLPSYLDNVLQVGIEWNGLLSSIPYISMLVCSLLFGWLGDLFDAKQWLSLTNNRKLFTIIGLSGPGLMCLLVGLLGAQYPLAAVLLLVVAGGLISAVFSGALVSFVDISPNFGGICFGMANTIGAFISAFAPYAEGIFVDRNDPMPGWSNVFYVAAACYFLFNTLYCVFGTAEVQTWNEPKLATSKGSSISVALHQ